MQSRQLRVQPEWSTNRLIRGVKGSINYNNLYTKFHCLQVAKVIDVNTSHERLRMIRDGTRGNDHSHVFIRPIRDKCDLLQIYTIASSMSTLTRSPRHIRRSHPQVRIKIPEPCHGPGASAGSSTGSDCHTTPTCTHWQWATSEMISSTDMFAIHFTSMVISVKNTLGVSPNAVQLWSIWTSWLAPPGIQSEVFLGPWITSQMGKEKQRG